MNISQRGLSIPASPLRKLTGVAEARKAQGVNVYHLNIGQPDLATPPVWFDALKQFAADPVAYAMSQGTSDTIDAWREYYVELGIDLAREELMITTGGSEALIFALALVADLGDNVMVFEPFYTNYTSFGIMNGVTMNPVTLRIDNNFHLPPDEEIIAAINSNTRAIMVCNPSNPTGTVFTPEELQRLVNLAVKHDLFIITDEVYREFAFDAPVKSLMQFPEGSDRVILIDSASKRFNLCGARIGVLASRNPDIMAAALRLGMARLSVATIEQQAIIPVLQQAATIIPPVVAEYRKRRDLVFEKLSSIPGVVTSRPEGAFYNICELPVDSAENFVRWTIEEFADNNETVLLAPAAGFYATPGKGEREIRLAYVLNCEQLTRALELLQLALENYPGKTAEAA